ncbi:hypothetical protein Ancab_012875 [Ancistrocladus abbreviatus]
MLRRIEQQLSRTRSKSATNAAEPTTRTPSTPTPGRKKSKSPEQSRGGAGGPPPRSPKLPESTGSEQASTSTIATTATYTAGSSNKSGEASISSGSSLSSLRDSLPENPTIYDISKIRAATNNFLAKRYSPSSTAPSWRCTLRHKDVIIFQRKFHKPTSPSTVREKLSIISKLHHMSIVKLMGASISGDFIYLVYEYVPGSNLADCLRNRINRSFTVLSTWMSRMQIATDLATGLDYIHNSTGLDMQLVHNHIKASSVIVAEPSLNARICHFGTAELCGEPVEEERESEISKAKLSEISEVESPKLMRSKSLKFQGTTGYMSPEFQATGIGSPKSDVFAFGVVILELLSGEEAVRYKFDKATRDYQRMSVVDSARAAVEVGGDGGGDGDGRLRRWIDGRLKDSFPVEVAKKMTRLALECVHVEANKRPDMRRVAGKISKLYLESLAWRDRLNVPNEFTVSFAPR